jgi:hypothetical protein
VVRPHSTVHAGIQDMAHSDLLRTMLCWACDEAGAALLKQPSQATNSSLRWVPTSLTCWLPCCRPWLLQAGAAHGGGVWPGRHLHRQRLARRHGACAAQKPLQEVPGGLAGCLHLLSLWHAVHVGVSVVLHEVGKAACTADCLRPPTCRLCPSPLPL